MSYKNHEDDWNKDNERGKKWFEGRAILGRHPPTPLQTGCEKISSQI